MNPHTIHLGYTLKTENDISTVTVSRIISKTETERVTILDQKDVFKNFEAGDDYLEAIAEAICDTLYEQEYFQKNKYNKQLSFAITQKQGGRTIYYVIKEI